MSSTLVLIIVLTLGAMLCVGYVIMLFFKGSSDGPEPIEHGEHGDLQDRRWHRSDDEHPDDIERQGSVDLVRPGAAPYQGRDPAHRYDGMTDAKVEQQATWQDRQLM